MTNLLKRFLIPLPALLAVCVIATSASVNVVAAESKEPSFSVTGGVTVGPNQLGVAQGERIFLDFMLDPGLSSTLSLSSQNILVFIDPWRWHWRRWDWLRGFIVRIPRLPIPEPDPWTLQIEAVFDDRQDMIMAMPGLPPLARGSAFITDIQFRPDAPFAKEGRLPTMRELNENFVGGSFMVVDDKGERLLIGKLEDLKGSETAPVCKGDGDADGDVDGTDVRNLRAEFGRKDCPLM
jgi:hypothetical protein